MSTDVYSSVFHVLTPVEKRRGLKPRTKLAAYNVVIVLTPVEKRRGLKQDQAQTQLQTQTVLTPVEKRRGLKRQAQKLRQTFVLKSLPLLKNVGD